MRGEFDKSTLCACMEISQWSPFLKLVYANEKNIPFSEIQIFKNRYPCILKQKFWSVFILILLILKIQ
jgi:hypothetical protein